MKQSNHSSLFDEQAPKKKLEEKKKVWLGLAILIGTPLLLWGLLLLSMSTYDSEQGIAGQVTIPTEWIEFTPKEPLRPSKDTQEVVLDAAEPLVRNNSNLKRIELESGTLVKPELQLIDQYGNIFNANVNRYPTPSRYNNGISCSVPYLPQDRLYTKVRVRSDQPLKLARILWHCHTWK